MTLKQERRNEKNGRGIMDASTKLKLRLLVAGMLLGAGIALIVLAIAGNQPSAAEFINQCNFVMGEGNWQVDQMPTGDYTCVQKRAVGEQAVLINFSEIWQQGQI